MSGESLFLSLPDETLQAVLAHATLSSLIAISATCRRLANLSGEILLWRKHCLEQYRFWSPFHDLPHRLQAPPGTTNWKKLLVERKVNEQEAHRLLDAAIHSQNERVQLLETIVDQGYDAKDMLLRETDETPDDASDALARRYWASSALGAIERSEAMREWKAMLENPDHPLERVLGAIDLWIAEKPPYTLDDISLQLDRMARSFQQQHPRLVQYSTRTKAHALVDFLSSQGFSAVQEQSYYDLQNSLIGVALFQEDHPALPLVVSAIYSCLGQRVGLNAKLCNFPLHIYCVIRSPDGFAVDGEAIVSSAATSDSYSSNNAAREGDADEMRRTMFMDPFHCLESLVDELRARLGAYGVPEAERQGYLTPAPTKFILSRTANNINNALTRTDNAYSTCLKQTTHFCRPLNAPALGPVTLNPYQARYCAAYIDIVADMHLRQAQSVPVTIQGRDVHFARAVHIQRALNHFAHDFERQFRSTDCRSLEKYLAPLFPPEDDFYNSVLVPVPAERVPNIIRGLIAQSRFVNDLELHRRHRPVKLNYAAFSEPDMAHQDDRPANELPERADSDQSSSAPNPGDDVDGRVAYSVGMLFRHARYRYIGAITGWDPECRATPAWAAAMNVDALPQGRRQPFYHVVSEDQSIRYVAQENIDPLRPEQGVGLTTQEAAQRRANGDPGLDIPPMGLMRTAGRWFLRWDKDENRFISNVREEWPDD